jgi:hypothetical protein
MTAGHWEKYLEKKTAQQMVEYSEHWWAKRKETKMVETKDH